MEQKETFWVLERKGRYEDFPEFVDEESNGYHGTYQIHEAIKFERQDVDDAFKPAYGGNKMPYVSAQYEVVVRKLS